MCEESRNHNDCYIMEILGKNENKVCSEKKIQSNELRAEDLELLSLRLPGFDISNERFICEYHYQNYITYYSLKHQRCCNPHNIANHKKETKKLIVISLDLYKDLKNICNTNVIPGKMICRNCFNRSNVTIKEYKKSLMQCFDPEGYHRSTAPATGSLDKVSDDVLRYMREIRGFEMTSEHKLCSVCKLNIVSAFNEYSSKKNVEEIPQFSIQCSLESGKNSSSSQHSIYQSESQKKRKLDEILETCDLPPFKKPKNIRTDKQIELGVEVLQNVINKVSTSIVDGYNVELPDFSNLTLTHNNSKWFQEVLKKIKFKYESLLDKEFSEKIQLLSLLPDDWNLNQVQKHFICTKHMFYEIKKLKSREGNIINNLSFFIIK